MNDWKLALFSGLSEASGMEDIIDTAAEAVRHHGFDYCSWSILLSRPHAQPMTLSISSVEDEIYSQISGDKLPTVSSPALVWSGMTEAELYAHAPTLLDDDRISRPQSGWVYPAKDSRTGAYSFFHADSRSPLSQEQLEHVSADMQWVAAAVHASMFYIPMRLTLSLTLREKSILTLISEGKSLEEIAEHMRLSMPTTAFHLECAEYKLQTPDQQQAAAKALFFDLLD